MERNTCNTKNNESIRDKIRHSRNIGINNEIDKEYDDHEDKYINK